MARSAIIKDLANSAVDTMTALKRAKVLFAELENDYLLKWVSYEITGYPVDANLPDYRKVRGRLVGSYFKGSMASHMKWTNVSLPLGTMPDKIQEALLTVYFREAHFHIIICIHLCEMAPTFLFFTLLCFKLSSSATEGNSTAFGGARI